MNKKCFAHSLPGRPEEEWEELELHLRKVAEKACSFAAKFGAGDWGYLAGLWHDLGKFNPTFQDYIRNANEAHIEGRSGRVNHSTSGALLAIERFGKIGRILAYCIAGHHAGLPDWQDASAPGSSLSNRLVQMENLAAARFGGIPSSITEYPRPADKGKSGTNLSRSLWVRMVFSCLVDADFLETECFMDQERSRQRNGCSSLGELAPKFEQYMTEKSTKARDTPVNRIRAEVLETCRAKAANQPGLFTLSVPTGGGKTLSSLAFALRHAMTHGKRRIIYVMPYTSIVEQTADQFRDIFADAVLEHHSNLDVDDPSRENARSRLACENWDAPIVVTTSVQFFESLFANRTSRCRKLHNIVDSVVVLDEAQLLPPDFLTPILRIIRELSLNYGVSFLLSTATQPALAPHRDADWRFDGLPGLQEVIEDPLSLHERLKRTSLGLIDGLATPLSFDELAGRLIQHDSVLCIVNRRDDARLLWEKMPEGTFHLSALMCGAHRSDRIKEIKVSLREGRRTRVISTQLVEAGVDLDFPIVYRALAGLDSLAQAAGRCNREGLLEQGMVHVFLPESKIPTGHLRQAAEIGRQLLTEGATDSLAPERFERFFRTLYWMKGDGLDKEGIMGLLGNDAELRISFRTAAGKLRLIDDDAYASVIVRYGEGARLIELLNRQGEDRWLLRRLQRYTVNLPRHVHARLVAEGAIQESHPGIFVQAYGNLYDEHLGFCADRSMIYEPDELVI